MRIYRSREGTHKYTHTHVEVFQQNYKSNLEIQVLNYHLVYLNTNQGHATNKYNSSFKYLSILMLNIYFFIFFTLAFLFELSNMSRKMEINDSSVFIKRSNLAFPVLLYFE